MVRAKMTVNSVTDFGHRKRVEFGAVYDDTIPEDQRFQKATPNAKAEFDIDNPAASDQFKPGDKFYVDFTPVEKAE